MGVLEDGSWKKKKKADCGARRERGKMERV